MPLYEYRCDSCNKVFEVIQKFSDTPLSVCETCGKPVYKLMSSTSFALKGTGWYTTDYKRKSAPTTAAAPLPAVIAPAATTTPVPAAAAKKGLTQI